MLRKLQQHEGQGLLGIEVSLSVMAMTWSGTLLKANSPDSEQVPLKMQYTSRIRVCQTWMNSGEEAFTRVAFCVQAGHFQLGRDSIAKMGVRNVTVPP